MIKTKVILKIISFILLLLGAIYIGLSQYSMGFDRDLVYREYVLETEYFKYINFLYLSIFWALISLFTCRELFYKNSLYRAFNVYVFIFIFAITALYQANVFISTMLFLILNIFGFFRILIFIMERKKY